VVELISCSNSYTVCYYSKQKAGKVFIVFLWHGYQRRFWTVFKTLMSWEPAKLAKIIQFVEMKDWSARLTLENKKKFFAWLGQFATVYLAAGSVGIHCQTNEMMMLGLHDLGDSDLCLVVQIISEGNLYFSFR
jgi:hypothetical protein